MNQARIVLPGGSGFLGQSLAAELAARGDEVVILTRGPRTRTGLIREVAWDGRTLSAWTRELEGTRAVVNFTGRSVNCRYTPANREEIVASRLGSVKVLGEAVRRCRQPPAVFVQAGSLAIFGDAGDTELVEGSPPGDGFSADVCRAWEVAFHAEAMPGVRKVLLRISFVLGRDGGALEPLANLARRFLGGTVGSGRQYVSWIHIEDLNAMFRWAIERSDIEGMYLATAPTPVTNAAFMRALRQALGRPWSPPVPAWAVKVGARLMGTEAELALTGRRGFPRRFLAQGFTFQHTDLQEALHELLAQP
jgi:uncharacterized protein